MAKKTTHDNKAIAGTLDLLKTINPEQATREHAQETLEELGSLFDSAADVLEEKRKQTKTKLSELTKKTKN